MIKGYIYLLKNKINGKCYIGQTRDFDTRLVQHLYAAETGSSCHIHRAIKKYGIDSFDISIIHTVEGDSNNIEQLLDEAERAYIAEYDSFNSGYNMTLGGEGNRGYRMTEEDRAKISAASSEHWQSPEYRDSVVSKIRGKKRSAEVRDKISAAKKGKPGRVWTDEQRQKLSEAHKGKIVSEDTRKKMSEVNKGQVPWNKGKSGYTTGKKHSEETKRKMSEAKKGKPPNNKGKPRSLEATKKAVETLKKRREMEKSALTE